MSKIKLKNETNQTDFDSNFLKKIWKKITTEIEQHILDTNAEKQLS